ncbi:hypothetical protein LL946_01270 [Knoellia locipacati]|uniref:hypothetical protein n=1 Tax=Knoellia locipacati TaxID=882824 RepID=UPI00384EA258
MRTSTSSSTGRVAAALATIALAGLVTITPAHAESGLNDDGVTTPAELRVWENENSGPSTPDTSTRPGPSVITIDDNAVEYLQVALGAVGGMAVLGALVAGSARRHGHAHPA